MRTLVTVAASVALASSYDTPTRPVQVVFSASWGLWDSWLWVPVSNVPVPLPVASVYSPLWIPMWPGVFLAILGRAKFSECISTVCFTHDKSPNVEAFFTVSPFFTLLYNIKVLVVALSFPTVLRRYVVCRRLWTTTRP